MKKLMILAAMMVATMGAKAQFEAGTFSLQPRVGVQAAIFTNMEKLPVGGGTSLDKQPAAGSLVGVDLEYMLTDKFSLTGGVNYSLQGTGWENYKSGSTKMEDIHIATGYVNVPITVSYYIVGGLAVKTGVQVGFLTNADLMFTVKDKYEGRDMKSINSIDMMDDFKKLDLSIPVGLSYEFKNHITLDARYNIGMTKINKESVPGEKDSKNGVFSFTVGYKFKL